MLIPLREVPIEAFVVRPLAPLPELAAHEDELLAASRPHVAKQRTHVGKLLPTVARHLRKQRALAVHDLIMRDRQYEIFAPRIQHSEGQVAMVILAMNRIEREVLQRIVHPSHVPFESEAQPTGEGRTADRSEE